MGTSVLLVCRRGEATASVRIEQANTRACTHTDTRARAHTQNTTRTHTPQPTRARAPHTSTTRTHTGAHESDSRARVHKRTHAHKYTNSLTLSHTHATHLFEYATPSLTVFTYLPTPPNARTHTTVIPDVEEERGKQWRTSKTAEEEESRR